MTSGREIKEKWAVLEISQVQFQDELNISEVHLTCCVSNFWLEHNDPQNAFLIVRSSSKRRPGRSTIWSPDFASRPDHLKSLAWLCRFANVKNIVGVNGYRYISHLESSILLDVRWRNKRKMNFLWQKPSLITFWISEVYLTHMKVRCVSDFWVKHNDPQNAFPLVRKPRSVELLEKPPKAFYSEPFV